LTITSRACGVRAARIHIVERGRDPRRCTLVEFGGAWPANACRVGRILVTPEVVPPVATGITLESVKTVFVSEYRRLYNQIFKGNPNMALTWPVRVERPKPFIPLALGQTIQTAQYAENRATIKGRRQAFFISFGWLINCELT
jgi:hypothetical protein